MVSKKEIERRKKISSGLKKAYSNGTRKPTVYSAEVKKKMSLAKLKNPTKYWLGKKFSSSHRSKISEFRKTIVGELHQLWKGDDACYSSKHQWVYRHYGKPNKCEFCGTRDAKRFDWANISGKYKRDKKDWIRLCKKCHVAYDDTINKGWATRSQNAD